MARRSVAMQSERNQVSQEQDSSKVQDDALFSPYSIEGSLQCVHDIAVTLLRRQYSTKLT
jgi:hypothetical protein